MDKKILIAYFSHSGNTRIIAERIQSITGGDLFEIVTKNPYPKVYNEVVQKAKSEKEAGWFLPELVDNGDITNYDVIFIGTPVWWYTMATPIKTFLNGKNFENKIVVPFCTHGGGGAASTFPDIRELANPKIFAEGIEIFRKAISDEELKSWIENLNL